MDVAVIKKKKTPEMIEMTKEELFALQERVKNKQLVDNDYIVIEKTLTFVVWVQSQILNLKISMTKLKMILFGAKTEKSNKKKDNEKSGDSDDSLPNGTTDDQSGENALKESEPNDATKTQNLTILLPTVPKKKGHGRIAANEYDADEVVIVPHETLKPGDFCPTDCGGRLYALNDNPGGIIRIKGQSCAHIVSYIFKKLRCALCGEVFIPKAPDDFSDKKCDETFNSIMVLQKYYLAVPFYRQEQYQKIQGIRLPASTQWECVESVANCVYPVFSVLETLAANDQNVNHDDTRVKILSIMKEHKLNPDEKRKGMYTTCIFSTTDDRKICLYYSGKKHGGENLLDLLQKRDQSLPPPIQMCDALSANMPKKLKTILSNCLVHARRNFKDIEAYFPQECGHVIDQIALVYFHDEQTKNMTKEERLFYHQENSAPIMIALQLWMQQQLDERKVEPNSALGKAINYFQEHWDALTKFLSIAGAHLDNNIVERALKLAIRTRKNAMFHKTEHGLRRSAIIVTHCNLYRER